VPGATSEAQQMLELVNAERAKTTCQPVRLDSRLNAAATKHSQDMATNDYFSHTSLDGATFDVRIKREGYPAPRLGDIAAGSRTAQGTFQQWMNSPGHRANILDCRAKDMGVGVVSASGSTYGTCWAQDFGFGA
jgi:uncharacterized protein YkwD